MIVADSDVLIDSLRGQKEAQKRIDLELKSGRLATTAVSLFELLSGARTIGQIEKVCTLLAPLSILPLDAEASSKAAEIRRALEAKGQGLAMADYLIAGICLVRGGTLLSRNLYHFERVPDLQLARLEPE